MTGYGEQGMGIGEFFIHMLRLTGAAALFAVLIVAIGANAARATETGAGAEGGESLAGASWRHAISMHDEPALPPGFAHLPYADPAAAAGGEMTLGLQGAFDSLNPLALGGEPVWAMRHLVFESLMARNWDEPFTLYGLLAEAVATPEDRSFVAFKLREEARFSDGSPVTIDDVIWSMETLREKGRPNHRYYYGQIARIEKIGPRSVKFHFKKPDRELPLLIGLMPVISKADWAEVDFQKNGFRIPLGSGPYKVGRVDPGRSIRFERDPNYWGATLGVNAGRYRIGRLNHLYFRDSGAIWEAFKAGDLDLFVENDPMRWRDGYGFPAARDGAVLRREVPIRKPSGMEGFVFNTRRPLFEDRRVREAIALAFDYGWVNQTYFAGKMRRIDSYFSGSPLGFDGAAAGAERALLAPFAADLPAGTLERGWRPQRFKDAAGRRAALRKAKALLEQAGWRVRDMALRNAAGRPFVFEILIDKRRHERVARSFAEDLEWLGIKAVVRLVDSAQRAQRAREYDYDMLVYRWSFSLSPGQEQRYYFGATGREEPGTRNYMGVADPAVDAMIDALLAAKSRSDFESAVRAYDRALSSGIYVIPWGWRAEDWIAHDAGLRIPERTPVSGFLREVLWRAPEGSGEPRAEAEAVRTAR